MYINPFVVGVLTTIFAELAAIFIYAIFKMKGN
jgi:hypothetical protein